MSVIVNFIGLAVDVHRYATLELTPLFPVLCSHFQRARLDELKIFLETEAWEPCPVRPSFTIRKLRVGRIHITRVCTHDAICILQ